MFETSQMGLAWQYSRFCHEAHAVALHALGRPTNTRAFSPCSGVGWGAIGVQSILTPIQVVFLRMPTPSATSPVTLTSYAASQSRPMPLAAAERRIGRFVLRQLIGRSSLTMAWLATDSRTGNDAMLMLPRGVTPDAQALGLWLETVRRAARLDHPHLLALSEFAEHEGWPYLVCECPPGATPLTLWLAAQAPPNPLDAARWCIDALDGLAYAHDAGVAHGDISLHSLIIDRGGRIRVWGLGAALQANVQVVMPGEMATLRQQRAAGSHDVLVVGLLLHQLLARVPALDEPDLPVAARRLTQEIARLPWDLPVPVPEALRTIVNRATDRYEYRRYLGARSLQRALAGWCKVEADGKAGALALLVDKLHISGHLPARPGLAQRVVQVMRMDTHRIGELTGVILEDPALSFELLKIVNSAQIGARRDQVVTTVRRAVELVGTTGIRRAAGNVRAWPGPLDPAAARALDRGLKLALLAGHLAELLVPAGLDAEAALLVAQMQHLGRLTVLYHFPDEAAQIDRLVASSPDQADPQRMTPGLTHEAAAMAVLGVSLEALAAALARHWGLDEAMQEMMLPLPRATTVHAPDGINGWLRLVASCANEVVEISTLKAALQGRALAQMAARYSRLLGVSVESLRDFYVRACHRLGNHVSDRVER
jgi:non-specific serine/threonine protein kinase